MTKPLKRGDLVQDLGTGYYGICLGVDGSSITVLLGNGQTVTTELCLSVPLGVMTDTHSFASLLGPR